MISIFSGGITFPDSKASLAVIEEPAIKINAIIKEAHAVLSGYSMRYGDDDNHVKKVRAGVEAKVINSIAQRKGEVVVTGSLKLGDQSEHDVFRGSIRYTLFVVHDEPRDWEIGSRILP